jgi:uncharacterized lipoprotein YajG
MEHRQYGAINAIALVLLAACFAAWAGVVWNGVQAISHQLEIAHVETVAADQRQTDAIADLEHRLSVVEARQQIVLEKMHIDGTR